MMDYQRANLLYHASHAEDNGAGGTKYTEIRHIDCKGQIIASIIEQFENNYGSENFKTWVELCNRVKNG